jgi:hypothetical protein
MLGDERCFVGFPSLSSQTIIAFSLNKVGNSKCTKCLGVYSFLLCVANGS